MAINKKVTSIDEYIAGFPSETQVILQKIRAIIRQAAPGAEETISYAIPTFKLNNSYLVYFAGYKQHVSLYPCPAGDADFEKEVATYRSGKGTIQFKLQDPLPAKLIGRVVALRIKENKQHPKRKAG